MNIHLRTIAFFNGMVLCVLALAMVVPILFAFADTDFQCINIFLYSAFSCLFIGIGIVLSCNPGRDITFSKQDLFLIVTGFWMLSAFFSSFPFYLYSGSGCKIDFISALFESTSGITTTGASIYNNVEALPSSIIIWRFILHLIGGVGIVAISIVALPSMKAGGMQLFNTENSDKSQKIMPRVSQIARYFVGLYFTMILVFSILLYSSGMSYIDAVCHSVSAISTGGFSTKNTGINYFNSRSIEIILAIAMFIGGLTFIEFIKCIRGEFISFYKNKQTKAYINSTLVILIFFITILFISDRTNISAKNVSSCLFDVISSITTTGFNLHTEVFLGSFFKIIMIILACVGGCSGSTTGGIKFFRIQILYSVLKKHIQHILRPFDASLSKYYSQRTRDSLMISVVSFFTMLAVVFIISLVFMCIFNGQKMTANIASVYSCIFNIGRPMGFSFSDFGGPEKVVLIIDMITGRLEIIPLFVICNRIFWKK